MGWAQRYIEALQRGETVSFRPRGSSMKGKVEDGQLCTVEPCTSVEVGDIVLCKVGSNEYLHLVKKERADGQWGIGNNRGKFNGWTPQKKIYGKLVKVER